MEWRDLAWAGPAGLVLTGGSVYLFAHRRRAPRAVRLALVAVGVSILLFAAEAALFRRFMTDYVWPRGGLLWLSPPDAWTAGQALINTVKAVLVALLLYAVVADRPVPSADDD